MTTTWHDREERLSPATRPDDDWIRQSGLNSNFELEL